MPHLTELVTIELGPRCNLGKLHPKCPTTHPERHAGVDTSRLLTDDMIVDAAVGLYRDHGFTGFIAYHGFSEPTLYADRMLNLSERIKAAWPASRFLLWTNATMLPADCSRYAIFDQCHATDYTADGKPPKHLDALRAVCKDVRVHPGVLDERLTAIGNSYQPCVRMFCEWNVSAHGALSICCFAWRGRDAIGNLFDDPLPVLVRRWQAVRDLIAGAGKMLPGAPRCCIQCGMRTQSFTSFAPEIAERARLHVANLRASPPAERSPGIIFVHYKLPPERLAAHWDWNGKQYREANARVFVTCDKEYPVPEYARCLVYPKPLDIFSLSATKNWAIKAALAEGCNPILSTDVDIAMPGITWDQFLRVRPGSAVIPNYKMIRTYEERNAEAPIDVGATGVVGMTADAWQQISYDERFIGYGAEDGALRLAIAKAGIFENRSSYVWHCAHNPAASQVNTPGHGRDDAWNRSTINPNRFLENRKLIH